MGAGKKKQAVFEGDTLDELNSFPPPAREAAGFQIYLVELGRDPDDWKPMKTVGPGVREIRIAGADGQFRVIYVAKFEEAVYVLHAFAKKTQKTPQRNLDIAAARYKALVKRRRERS
jgi:phage-related protein